MLSAVLKKKHSKTGEESRYQGTVLGKPAEDKLIVIEGSYIESIKDWEAKQKVVHVQKELLIEEANATSFSSASSPLSDVQDV